MIIVRELVKKYGSRIALDHLNLEIEDKGVIGLLGPNGAGKSTFMQILCGCLMPTEGTVEINGMSMARNPLEIKKKIGYLPELPPVYPDLTPYEYLDFVGRARGLKGSELDKEICSALESTSTDDVKDRLIKTLSKGYRQRVGIAQAVMGDPMIIVLDEPMVGLDPVQIMEFKRLIRKLGEKCLVLISSHIISSISELADRIIVINKGNLVAAGTIEELSDCVENSEGMSLEGIYLNLVGKEDCTVEGSI